MSLQRNFTNIGIAGDWHGNKGWSRIALNTFGDFGITEIVSVGDFGFWPGNAGQKFLHRVNKILCQNGQTLYVTLGNHEDYVQVSTFQPHPTVAGHVYKPSYPNILVAVRGARWEWEGVSFVSLGGANSIDFNNRTEWLSWWKAEQISLADVYVTAEGGHAEVMITHDCPAGVNLFGGEHDAANGWSPTQLRYAVESREMLRHAVNAVKPDVLFHGHYHMFKDITTELNDGVDGYALRSVGLDMDASKHNLGVLSLPEKKFNIIPANLNIR